MIMYDIIIHYNTQKQKEKKLESRIKWDQNISYASLGPQNKLLLIGYFSDPSLNLDFKLV